MERQQVTFNGYVPMESVIKYIQEFEYLIAVKLYTVAQQKAVLLGGAQGIVQGTGDTNFI